jgi:hypothetical protein
MTIRLPLYANELIDTALNEAISEGGRVEEEMMGYFLPRSINVILKFDEEAQKISKPYPKLLSQESINEVAQTLWSYPGSMGVGRIRDQYQTQGLDQESAVQLSQLIFNLTRYPMSVVNYMRHMRSSINSIRNISFGPKAPDSILNELGITKKQKDMWTDSSLKLNSRYIESEEDFEKWLFEVEMHLREYLPLQSRISRAMTGREYLTQKESSGLAESAAARAYVRRFGNYVAAHAKFKEFGSSVKGRGSKISDEFAELQQIYAQTEHKIYIKLKTDFEIRSRRLSASPEKQEIRNDKSSRYASPYQNQIEQLLNLNGKNVKITTSSSLLPEKLIRQFIKSLYLQFEINPEQKSLNSRLNVGSDSIEIQIESPAKADIKKVQTFIESMYLS